MAQIGLLAVLFFPPAPLEVPASHPPLHPAPQRYWTCHCAQPGLKQHLRICRLVAIRGPRHEIGGADSHLASLLC